LPREETTPPVTKRNLGLEAILFVNQDGSSVYQKNTDTSQVSDFEIIRVK
jgi:sensor domain CHASE-containing protein